MKKNKIGLLIVVILALVVVILVFYVLNIKTDESIKENGVEVTEKYKLLFTNSNYKYVILSDDRFYNNSESVRGTLDDNVKEIIKIITSDEGFSSDPREGITLYDVENDIYYKIDIDSPELVELNNYFMDETIKAYINNYGKQARSDYKCLDNAKDIPASFDENLYVFEKTDVVGLMKNPFHGDGSVYYYKSCGYIPYALENYNIIFTYPKLTINSSDSDLVNQNIRNQIDNLIESYHNNEGQDWGCVSYEINDKTILTTHFIYYSYDIYKVRDYLTIIVTKHAKTSCATGSSDFVISYMIDSSGKLASKDEIISLYGFDEESLKDSYMNNIHMDKFIFNGAFMDRNGNLVINVNTDGAAKPTGNYYLKDGKWSNFWHES